jgi:protein-tyrosine phosphatase
MASDTRYRICFVCSGNICRSPIAEVVLRRQVEEAGLGQVVVVDSAGTGDWHVGDRADRRALAVLTRAGLDGDAHRARQFDPRWFLRRDLVVALDRGHLRTLRSWAANDTERGRLVLLRTFDPATGGRTAGADLDVPDPYYDGMQAFEEVLDIVTRSCAGLLEHVRGLLDDRPLRAV